MSAAARHARLAVLSADIVGYTALMQADEWSVHARAMAHLDGAIRPAIARQGGRIVKHTGDGFLAVFEDCDAALAAALAIQADVAALDAQQGGPALPYRMGLHLTDAIVEAHDVFGEGVNLAARLQAAAEPGRILVSAVLHAALSPAAASGMADLGVLALKNMRGAVRAYGLGGSAAAPQREAAARPSIAVMPFRQRPPDPESEWFAAGVIEGVLHVLGGIDNLLVIARGTALAHAARTGLEATDPVEVGRALSVRYVLNGTVERRAGRLRILTELADATTGATIRTDRHDGEDTDLFEMQDRIASDVVAAIAPSVHASELARAQRQHPESLSGYDLLLRGLDVLYRMKREEYDEARGLLQQAMAADTGFGSTYAHAATWHMFRIGQGWSPNLEADAAEAARCADGALERDPNNAVALAIKGQMLSFTRREYAAALRLLDRAVALGPNCHMAFALRCATRNWTGDVTGALADGERAMRISPLDPFAFFAEHMLSQAHYFGGDFAAAIEWGRRAESHTPRLTSNLRTLTAALVADDRLDEARQVAARMLAIEPGFGLVRFAARSPFAPELRATYVTRLRAAGLPE